MKYSTVQSLFLIILDSVKNIIASIRHFNDRRICYHVETAEWSVKNDGQYVTRNIRSKFGVPANISYSPLGVFGQVLHFGSIYLEDRIPAIIFRYISKWNRIVVTFYHIESNDHRVETLRERIDMIDVVHTSCSVTRDALINRGVPEAKIKIVPIGVDTGIFRPLPDPETNQLRDDLGLPENSVIIGSFQKDSHGWGESVEPKLVKGPDILVDVAKRLNEEEDIHFLLVGPARGYVKQQLNSHDVPYTHVYLEDYEEIPKYYNLLHFYLITSRSEGGPKAIPESLATGTPLISTRVGMAPDVLESGKNGFVEDVEDVDALVERSKQLISDPSLRKKFERNGLKTAKGLTWESVAEELYSKIYSN